MKIKGLLLGMFACAALVACTNDDIVENNNIEQPEKVKANLTLSISTSTGSGRAADAETGDDVENGTPSEGSIKDAVIIISPVQGNTATGLVEYADNITVTSGVYEPSFQLNQTGSYNVLVILNPCADIANKAKETSATAAGVYEYVTNYSITAGSSNDASVDVVTKGASARDHFMMANSEAAMVNITSQDPTQPIIQAIRVERVVSKITFTPNNNDNKYNVKVKVTTIPTVTTDGWLKTTTADKTSYIYITKLNKALLDADNAEIWVLLNGGNETGRYQLESTLDNKYKGNVKQNETTTSIEAPVFVATVYARQRMRVVRSEYSGEWNISNKSMDGGNIKAVTTYGTKRITAYHILEQTLNQRVVKVFDTVVEDGKERPVLNVKETAIAQDRQELIKSKFADWLWQDIDRRERLCRIYNDTFNSIRPREYDGSHLRFVGMNPEITLRKHQVNAIAHVLYGGNTLLAHEVGAGKT